MTRLLVALVVALALAGSALAVNPRFWITAITIGDANLHWPRAQYLQHWGTPAAVKRIDARYTRLRFPRRHIDVYLRAGRQTGVAIVTWDRRDRTLDRIGPCSPVVAFERAYAGAPAVREKGRIIGYRLGRLIFFARRGRIVNVMLAVPGVPTRLAFRARACA